MCKRAHDGGPISYSDMACGEPSTTVGNQTIQKCDRPLLWAPVVTHVTHGGLPKGVVIPNILTFQFELRIAPRMQDGDL